MGKKRKKSVFFTGEQLFLHVFFAIVYNEGQVKEVQIWHEGKKCSLRERLLKIKP